LVVICGTKNSKCALIVYFLVDGRFTPTNGLLQFPQNQCNIARKKAHHIELSYYPERNWNHDILHKYIVHRKMECSRFLFNLNKFRRICILKMKTKAISSSTISTLAQQCTFDFETNKLKIEMQWYSGF